MEAWHLKPLCITLIQFLRTTFSSLDSEVRSRGQAQRSHTLVGAGSGTSSQEQKSDVVTPCHAQSQSELCSKNVQTS